MQLLEAIILGLIQGLTEFLPVSSSGHIELASALLQIVDKEENLLFSIIVHAATALSTIVVFRKDIQTLVKGLLAFRYNEETKFISKLLLSAVPLAIVGLLFEEYIEQIFGGKMLIIGTSLLFTAFLLLLTHYVRRPGGPVTYKKAIFIGLAQVLAILPGLSRSGTTIATALLIGVEREKAARFSFLMVLVPILGAAFLKLLAILQAPALVQKTAFIPLLAGFIAAFVAGLLACKWMINIVKKGKLTYFALYCFIVGLLAIGTFYVQL